MREGSGRQLAAIMFADMVGYTALMQEDEDEARAKRDYQRKVLEELVSEHHGEILQYYGDGTLSIFPSAVEAVKCAVAVQLALREEPSVPLRIGLHTGDVVQDENGVYGDGVNVASRIQGLAPSGGVMISGKVFDEIKNHPDLTAVPLGPVQLKNVGNPVRVFGISNGGLAVPTREEILAGSVGAPGEAVAGQAPPGEPRDAPDAGLGEAFLQRVKERAMIQWALVYLAVAWTFLQAMGFAGEQLHWPARVDRGLDVLALMGFFIAMVIAWYHGERGRQAVRPREMVLISALLVAGIGMLALVQTHDDAGPSSPIALPAADAENSRQSVAVLPFDNFSPDPDDAYFANGIQEDITTALSRIRALRVPARSSVDRFREDRPGSREMAAALGVDFLLEGSTTVVGGMARVTVQLIDGRTDQHIWAENYDREFTVANLIAVRTAVAQEVAARLQAFITPQEQGQIAHFPTADPKALEFYQRARYRWNERTREGVRESLNLFKGAIDLDPDFAEAYAGLADAYLVLANRGWMDHREGHRLGIEAAEKALALDSLNVLASASLGALNLWSTRDWSRSEDYFLRAIRLDREYAYTHYWYAALLSALGRHEESIAQAREAKSLDGLSPQIASGPARSLFLARRFRQAIGEALTSLEVHPDYAPIYAQICRSHLALGEFSEAEAACRIEQEKAGVNGSLSMALVYAFQGDRERAFGEIRRLESGAGGADPQPIILAMVYAGLGDIDAGLQQIETALEGDYPYIEYLPSNPFLDPLREDPRFGQYLQRIGLGG